jgi:hypothetical protein
MSKYTTNLDDIYELASESIVDVETNTDLTDNESQLAYVFEKYVETNNTKLSEHEEIEEPSEHVEHEEPSEPVEHEEPSESVEPEEPSEPVEPSETAIQEIVVLDNKTNNASVLTDNLEYCYTRLVELVNGTVYSLENWTLLIIKALKCVSHVKKLTAEEQCDLAVEVIVMYLDNNTSMSDDVLEFVKYQALNMVKSVLVNQDVNKKNHKANQKGSNKLQVNIEKNKPKTDIDVLASPLQIVNSVVNKLEAIVKTRKLTFDMFMSEVPSLVMSVVGLVDKYKHLTSTEKKQLLMQSLQVVLKSKVPVWFNLDDKQVKTLEYLSQGVPLLVEASMGVANGDLDFHIDFNKPAKLLKSLRMLIPLCGCCKCCKK